MSHSLEPDSLRRWKGLRIVAISFLIGLIGIAPLLGYIVTGASGNPMGVGLTALIAMALATVGVLVGLIKLIMEVFASETF